ncbi:MAG: hypothetical protein M0005_10370 [Actinomycetota bacterium]|nr:hypothetical protein [Actinomycetota bacterium]
MSVVRVRCARHGVFLVAARACQVDDRHERVVAPCPSGHSVVVRAGAWQRLWLAAYGAPEVWPAGCLLELVDDLDRFARGEVTL